MRPDVGPVAGRTARRLPAGFGRNVALLVGGTTVAQAIGVLASPILSRVYSPEAFGTFGVFMAVVSLAAVAVSLRYETALPMAERDDDAWAILALTLALALAAGVAAALGAWLVLGTPVGDGIAGPLREALVLVPIALVLTGVHQALVSWATRAEAFDASARASVAQSSTTAAGQVAFGLAGTAAPGLAAGYVLGRLAGIGALVRTLGADPLGRLRGVPLSHVRSAASQYRRFPLISLWSSLLNNAGFQVPILILAGLFHAAIAGWFLLTVRVLQLPLALIGTAVGQVYYARVGRSNPDDLRTTTSAVFSSLVVLGIGPMLLLALGGPEAFAIAFGEAWREAGRYAAWLAPWLLIVFVASPLSTMVFVLSKQRGELAFQVILLAGRVGGLLVGWWIGSPDAAIALFGIASAVLWAIYLAWLLTISRAGWREPLRQVARELAIAAALALPLVAANLAGLRGWAWAGVAAAVLVAMLVRAALRLRGELAMLRSS